MTDQDQSMMNDQPSSSIQKESITSYADENPEEEGKEEEKMPPPKKQTKAKRKPKESATSSASQYLQKKRPRKQQIQESETPSHQPTITESEDSRASAQAQAPSDASMEQAGASSSKDVVRRPQVRAYVEQANKQTQVTKTEIIEEKGDRKFVCQTCGEVFAHGQALGGHMSRTHPNSSQAYNKKV